MPKADVNLEVGSGSRLNLGVPCLRLRSGTERPVTVSLGTNVLIRKDLGGSAPSCQEGIHTAIVGQSRGGADRGSSPYLGEPYIELIFWGYRLRIDFSLERLQSRRRENAQGVWVFQEGEDAESAQNG